MRPIRLCLGLSEIFILGLYAAHISAQEPIPFDSPRWQHLDSEVTEIAGRSALMGAAVLTDADFTDGIIEYDLYITGGRSYPGVYVRFQDQIHGEHFYVRPHRARLYPDAVQYCPVVNGIAEWQLYNGPGFTSTGVFTESEWIPVRLEIRGTQARYFVEAKVMIQGACLPMKAATNAPIWSSFALISPIRDR